MVVVPFPFADLSTTKRRPALVVAVLKNGDVLLCQITSQKRHDSYSIELGKSDLLEGKLDKPSWIRPNRLFTSESAIVLYRAGRLKQAKLKEVVQKIVEIVQAE